VSPSPGASRGRRPDQGRGRPAGRDPGLAVELGVPALVFAVAVGVAELAGAANLGVAFGVGQVAFVVVLVAVLIRR
jgi:hypothetical protein